MGRLDEPRMYTKRIVLDAMFAAWCGARGREASREEKTRFMEWLRVSPFNSAGLDGLPTTDDRV
jgi:hypothetical protein